MLYYVFKDAAEWDVILSPLQCQQKFCMLKKSVITTLWCYFSHLRIQRIFMQLIFIKSSQRSGHIRGSPKKVQYTIKLGQTTRCLMHMLKATTLRFHMASEDLEYCKLPGLDSSKCATTWVRKRIENRSINFECIIPLTSGFIFPPKNINSVTFYSPSCCSKLFIFILKQNIDEYVCRMFQLFEVQNFRIKFRGT